MDWDDMLALMTLSAVAPYVTVAAKDWLHRTRGH